MDKFLLVVAFTFMLEAFSHTASATRHVPVTSLRERQRPRNGHPCDSDLTSQHFRCPFTCECFRTSRTMRCQSNFYTMVPMVPEPIRFVVMDRIDIIQNMAFTSSSCVERLKISYTEKDIQPKSLYGLRFLSELHIQHSNISVIPESLFCDLQSLRHLILNNNRLREIPNEPLCSTVGLESFRINQNELQTLKFGNCFTFLENLTYIDLTQNHINNGRVKYDDFENLRNSRVQHLAIESCNISHISPGAFRFLTNLKTLHASSNNFLSIPLESFSRLTNLQTLFLDSTRLQNLDFKKLISINITKLSLNVIKIITLNNSTLSSVRRFPLRYLSLENCRMKSISSDGLAGFSLLQHLNLKYNHLTQDLLDKILYGLSGSKATLTILNITLNIKILNENSFRLSKLYNLSALHIYDGVIDSIMDYTFTRFPNLIELRIENCRIYSISNRAFHNLKRLEILSLSKNAIADIDHPRLNLESLKTLDLSRNKLSRLYQSPFKSLVRLETLLLAANGIRDIDISQISFNGLSNLRTLDLSKNQLNQIFEKDTSPFVHLLSLQTLLLNQNRLSRMKFYPFRSLTRLKYLNLAGNEFWSQEEQLARVFQNLTNLQVLSLQNCGVKRLPIHLFRNLVNLRELYLSQNTITSWNPNVFKSLQKLVDIRIRDNKISIINETSFMWLKSLEVLGLSYNPFECSCNNLWFRNWLQSSNVSLSYKYTYPFPQRDIYTCASPTEEKDLSLFKFTITQNDCEDNAILLSLELVAGLFIGCIICISVVIRYRWYLRYWLYVMKSKTARYAEITRDDEFAFDAFVCYHEKDLTWVLQYLLPNVEYNGGFRLCLHHRNWPPGYDIIDNIVQSIEMSRKTILILTNDFAVSNWCQLEAKLAQHKYLDDNRDVIILVMLEQIKIANMNSRLKSLLCTKTYLMWTKDEKGQKLFWKRLRSALRKPEMRGHIAMTGTDVEIEQN